MEIIYFIASIKTTVQLEAITKLIEGISTKEISMCHKGTHVEIFTKDKINAQKIQDKWEEINENLISVAEIGTGI